MLTTPKNHKLTRQTSENELLGHWIRGRFCLFWLLTDVRFQVFSLLIPSWQTPKYRIFDREKQKKKRMKTKNHFGSLGRDSNPGPLACKYNALTRNAIAPSLMFGILKRVQTSE